MRRVLNSGGITLTAIHDTYKEDLIVDKQDAHICNYILSEVQFEFDIKAPILILQSFQKARLGELTTFEVTDAQEAYLPPYFYKFAPSGLVQMDAARCNDLYTKYSNFYRNVSNFYLKLLEQGVCQAEAALVLPLGLFTTFHLRVSGKALLDFINAEKDKSAEMYGYCEAFLLYLNESLPRTMACLKK